MNRSHFQLDQNLEPNKANNDQSTEASGGSDCHKIPHVSSADKIVADVAVATNATVAASFNSKKNIRKSSPLPTKIARDENSSTSKHSSLACSKGSKNLRDDDMVTSKTTSPNEFRTQTPTAASSVVTSITTNDNNRCDDDDKKMNADKNRPLKRSRMEQLGDKYQGHLTTSLNCHAGVADTKLQLEMQMHHEERLASSVLSKRRQERKDERSLENPKAKLMTPITPTATTPSTTKTKVTPATAISKGTPRTATDVVNDLLVDASDTSSPLPGIDAVSKSKQSPQASKRKNDADSSKSILESNRDGSATVGNDGKNEEKAKKAAVINFPFIKLPQREHSPNSMAAILQQELAKAPPSTDWLAIRRDARKFWYSMLHRYIDVVTKVKSSHANESLLHATKVETVTESVAQRNSKHKKNSRTELINKAETKRDSPSPIIDDNRIRSLIVQEVNADIELRDWVVDQHAAASVEKGLDDERQTKLDSVNFFQNSIGVMMMAKRTEDLDSNQQTKLNDKLATSADIDEAVVNKNDKEEAAEIKKSSKKKPSDATKKNNSESVVCDDKSAEKTWEDYFDGLMDCKASSGNFGVFLQEKSSKPSSSANDSMSWILQQRRLCKERKLDPKRFKLMNQVGFAWEGQMCFNPKNTWWTMFHLLRWFARKNNHTYVPLTMSVLFKWLQGELRALEIGRLSCPNQQENLRALTFGQGCNNSDCEIMYRAQLKDSYESEPLLASAAALYAKQQESASAVKSTVNQKHLSHQNHMSNHSKSSPTLRPNVSSSDTGYGSQAAMMQHHDQAAMMPHQAPQQYNFQRASQEQQFVRQLPIQQQGASYASDSLTIGDVGSFRMDQASSRGDAYLGNLASKEENASGGSRTTDQQWESFYEGLLVYQSQHGNVNVPGKSHLSNWVATQRSNQQHLSESQFQRLNKLGIFEQPTEDPR